MLSILMSILILLVFCAIIYWAIVNLPLPAPIQQIANVIVVVIFALGMLAILMGKVPVVF